MAQPSAQHIAKKRKLHDGVDARATKDKQKPRPASLLGPHEAILAELSVKYNVHPASVISSSKIQKKVTSVLRHLTTATAAKPRVSVLRAKAADAGKLISISEIAKRELAKDQSKDVYAGRWFQYIGLGEEVHEVPRDVEGRTIVEDTILGARSTEEMDADKTRRKEAEAEDDDDGGFEHMKTPFERAIEGRPRKRAVPMMCLFLSRVPITELSKRYGEQSNPETAEGKT